MTTCLSSPSTAKFSSNFYCLGHRPTLLVRYPRYPNCTPTGDRLLQEPAYRAGFSRATVCLHPCFAPSTGQKGVAPVPGEAILPLPRPLLRARAVFHSFPRSGQDETSPYLSPRVRRSSAPSPFPLSVHHSPIRPFKAQGSIRSHVLGWS